MASPNNDAVFFGNRAAFNTTAGAIGELVQKHIERLGPSLLVQVKAVHPGEASITGSVDVQPLVQQQDALGRPVNRAIIHNVPYLRIQGGTSALIIDPKPGDIGFIVISGRDHTHVVTARQPAPSASTRVFSMSDCVYVGGFLNNGPDQFIQATDKGWRIVTPGTVSIEATRITANCDFETSGDVKAGGVSLKQHMHGGVQAGADNTSGPV